MAHSYISQAKRYGDSKGHASYLLSGIIQGAPRGIPSCFLPRNDALEHRRRMGGCRRCLKGDGMAHLGLGESDDLLSDDDEASVLDVLLDVRGVAGSHGVGLDHGKSALERSVAATAPESCNGGNRQSRSLEGRDGNSSPGARSNDGRLRDGEDTLWVNEGMYSGE